MTIKFRTTELRRNKSMAKRYIYCILDRYFAHATGTAVSFRTGNSTFKIDDFKIFRSRATTTSILVGAANTNDLRNENISPNIYGGNISSITKDNANNLSVISNQYFDIDWTKPIASTVIKDGTSTDIDTTYIGTQLDLNYTMAKTLTLALLITMPLAHRQVLKYC